MICALIRIKVRHKNLIDPKEPYVIISNHTSQLDIVACAISNPGVFKFLAKVDLLKIPFFGYAIKKMYITVKRESKEDRARSLEKMAASLDDGISVHIFVEGSRNRTSEPLKSFYDGAFKLAIESGMPLAVLTIVGSSERNSPGRFPMLSPGTITCHWDEPINTQGMTLNDVSKLKARCRELMMGHIAPNRESVPA